MSRLAAPPPARRIGLVDAMVFSAPHSGQPVPDRRGCRASSLEVALGLLLVRSLLSGMDVPTRSAYVISMIAAPEERPAAASYTSVTRSLASPDRSFAPQCDLFATQPDERARSWPAGC